MAGLKTSLLKMELIISEGYGVPRVNAWMRKKRRSVEDLGELLPFINNELNRFDVAHSWMNHEGRTFNDLTGALLLINDKKDKDLLTEFWITQEERTWEDLATVLALSDDVHYKPAICESWLSRKGSILENLTAVLALFNADDNLYKSEIAKSWLGKKGRTFEDLTAVLPFFDDEEDKSEIAKSWIDGEERTLEDLKVALPFVTNFQHLSEFAESWVSKKERTLEEVVEVSSLSDNLEYKFSIASSWVCEKRCTLEDLKAVLPIFDNAVEYKPVVAACWLMKPEKTLEDLTMTLALFDDARDKSEVAKYWLEKEVEELEKFIAVVALSDDINYKYFVTKSWVSKEGKTLEDLTAALLPFDQAQDKIDIATSWLSNESRTLDDLDTVLSLFDGSQDILEIAISWLKKEGKTSEDLTAVLSLFDDAEDQSMIAISWLAKQEITLEDLKAALPFTEASYQSAVAASWLGKEGRTSEDLTSTLALLDDAKDKSAIATSWVNKEARTLEELKVVLPLVTCAPHKSYIAKYLMSGKASGEKSTFEYLTAVLSLFDDANDKSVIARSWLYQDQDPQTRYEHFTTLAKTGILSDSDRYDIRKIASAYCDLSLPTNKLTDLCTDLYPNSELLQTELFKRFITITDFNSLSDTKPCLTSFIQNLHEDEFVLEAITAVENRLDLSALEILEITKNRLSSKYESVSDLLKGKTLEESLSEAGLANVRKLFSNNTAPIDINLADLFSYYDIREQLAEFKSLLLPEVLQEIASSFSPSSKTAYIPKAEFRKMSDLFNNEATPESNFRLPSVKIVADYLSSKVGDIGKALTPEEINNYQFGNSKILPAESRENITQQFRNLLGKTNSTAEVSDFFEAALHITNNDENSQKMCNLFNDNKSLLALLFQQEEGLDNFAGAIIVTLTDGCGANIATQSKIALYQALISDPCDQVLFATFKTKISGAILNSGGDLLTGSTQGINIFQDHNINKNFISPNGLLAALSEEFYYNGKIIKNAPQFIKNEAGENTRDNLVESVLEKDGSTFDQEIARISAYIVLQKTLPDLCENKYLSKPQTEYLEIIQEGLKQKLAESLNNGVALEEIHLEDHPDSSVIPSDSSQVVHDISMAVHP